MKLKFTFIAILAMLSSFAVNAANSQQVDVVLPTGVSESTFGANTVTDGTNYYATLQAATEAVAGNAGAVLYCKPSAEVGSLQHAPVTATLTVYGNGASVTGGSERDFDLGNTDPSSGKDITADMTLTVKHLNGCGAWGAKATEHTVNLVFENCANMGKVFITGTTGTLNITMTDCAFEGVLPEAVYSNADGAITLNNVAFSNLNKAINLNHKAAGTQTVTINGCSFTNCGNNVAADQIPVRVLTSVEGGKSVLNVSNTTFTGTPEGGADILLDYGVGVTEATVTGTAANVLPENKDNNAVMVNVTANEGYSNVAPTDVKVATLAELQAALAAENKLPIIITAQIVIPQGETIVLDLNGKTVNSVFNGTSTTNHIYALSNKGTLTIQDSKGNGSINSRGIYNYGSLTLNAGAINAIDGNGGYAVNNQSGTTFVMNGGVVAATNEDDHQSSSGGYDATALKVPAGCTATLNGGTINNVCDFTYAIDAAGTLNIPAESTITVNGTHGAINVNGGETTIDAGTFQIPADEYSRTDNVLYVSGGSLVVNGGTFIGDSDTAAGGSCLYDAAGKAVVNGGTFKGSSGGDVWGTTGTTIKGGTFENLTETKHIADGYELGADGKVTSSIAYVAMIGEQGYATLEAAIGAAQEGDEIVLLADVEQADGIIITDKKITIDLGGKTFKVTEGASTNNRNLKINGTSVVTIKNGTMIADGNYSSGAYGTIRTEGTANVTLTGLKLYNYRGNGLNIKACGGTSVTVENTEIYANYGGGIEAAGGTIVVNNVTVKQQGMYTAPYNSMAISVNGGGKVTVNSGTYSTECITAEEANGQGSSHGPWVAGVLNSGGTLIINGGTFSNDNFGDNSLTTAARGAILADTKAKVEINGGTFNVLKNVIDIQNNLGDTNNNPSVLLVGGTYSADPRISAQYGSNLITLAENYVAVENNGVWTVVEAGLAGEGTEANPYLISSVDDLVLFRNSVNAGETKYNAEGVYVALGANIDLAGIDWSVNIGDDCAVTFDGIFDGKGYTISNLTATETATKADGYICTGLFGAIYDKAVVKNFTLENVTINAPFVGNNVSAVVGFAYACKGSIENVKVVGVNIDAPKATGVGAIVGYDYYSPALKVENCIVDGANITAAAYAGGLVGYASSKIAMNNNTIEDVTVSATASVGAVAGIMLGGGSATDNTVKNVTLTANGALWANSSAVVAGTITGGAVTVSNTTVENVTANGAAARLVGGILVEKPTTEIAKVQAQIGDKFYTTLQAAATAAKENETVTLIADVEATEALNINCALDLNGHSLMATVAPTALPEGYAALPNLDGKFVIGAQPTATVNNLGMTTVAAGKYSIWDGSFDSNTEDDGDMPLSFVMQFLADQDAEDMATSPFADWYGDFVLTFTGLENGSFTADNCYLAGHYGSFGWVKIPVDGMVIEDGARYPVMLGVGIGQKYDYICSSVEDFKCALYLAPEILEANPNIEVKLELGVVDNSKGSDAAASALVNNENVYSVTEYTYDALDFDPSYIAEFVIDDANSVDFVNDSEKTVGTLTYKRNLIEGIWNALYLPFEIDVEELVENYDIAYYNQMHSYDSDNNGSFDSYEMEVAYITSGRLRANYPYFIRPKSAEACALEYVAEDVTLYPAVEKQIVTSSVANIFTLSGTHKAMGAGDLNGCYAISVDGDWSATAGLKAHRLYLKIEENDNSPFAPSAAKSIRIVVRGEGDGTTGIEGVEYESAEAIYDLSGRRVQETVKGGIYIVNGKKVLVK